MGSLVAAVACVFVLAGGVVAFNGWPELGSEPTYQALVVADVPRAPIRVAPVRRTPTRAASSTPRRSSGAAPRSLVRPVARRVQTRPNPTPGRPTTPSPTNTPASSGSSGADQPPPGALEPVANTTESTTSGLGDTVTGLTQTLGDTVGGSLGETVTAAGASLGRGVSNTGATLANILRALGP